MKLENAIRHAIEIAQDRSECAECREEHWELACWLYELYTRRLKDALRNALAEKEEELP